MDRKRRRILNSLFIKHSITMDEVIQIEAGRGNMNAQDLVSWGDAVRNRIHQIARLVSDYEKKRRDVRKAGTDSKGTGVESNQDGQAHRDGPEG
jgi:hypothetical protein